MKYIIEMFMMFSFASNGASSDAGRQMANTVSDVAEHASRGEMILENISGGSIIGNVLGDGSKFLPNLKVSSKPFALTRELQRTELIPIIEWCETEYTPFDDIPFEDELDGLSKQAVMFN